MHSVRRWLLWSLVILTLPSDAQADSCRLRVSLLTCGPGTDLYSVWGHTAIRVIDSSAQSDIVFNYGVFDDSDPMFYLKFTRGIMNYVVAPFDFESFMQEYQEEKRSVTEQVLAIDCTEKQRLLKALWMNCQKENRTYPYHFYADNCTTRARDILTRNLDKAPEFVPVQPSPASTYRSLIHSYMRSSSQSWNRLSIDLLLGTHLDETMNTRQAMFLPDYLMKGFDSARIAGKPLVAETNILLASVPADTSIAATPLLVFSILLLVFAGLAIGGKRTANALLLADRILFIITGLLGALLLTLWIARVDSVCRNNLNLAWALPTHLVAAFALKRKSGFWRYYWMSSAIINGLLLAGWKWLPQDLNNALIPLVALLLFRSVHHYIQTGKK